jgi:hypothetical protein
MPDHSVRIVGLAVEAAAGGKFVGLRHQLSGNDDDANVRPAVSRLPSEGQAVDRSRQAYVGEEQPHFGIRVEEFERLLAIHGLDHPETASAKMTVPVARTNASSSTIRTKAGRRDVEGTDGNTQRGIPVHGPAFLASMKTPHTGYKVALAALAANWQPGRRLKFAPRRRQARARGQRSIQTENAAQSRPAPPIVAMVATEAAEQQDHQDDN